MRYKLLFLNEKNKPETSILVNIERITVTDTLHNLMSHYYNPVEVQDINFTTLYS